MSTEGGGSAAPEGDTAAAEMDMDEIITRIAGLRVMSRMNASAADLERDDIRKTIQALKLTGPEELGSDMLTTKLNNMYSFVRILGVGCERYASGKELVQWLVQYGKLSLLVQELVLTSVWRVHIFPALYTQAKTAGTYSRNSGLMLLLYQITCIRVLAHAIGYQEGLLVLAEAADSTLASDLVDLCVEYLTQFSAKKCINDEHTHDEGRLVCSYENWGVIAVHATTCLLRLTKCCFESCTSLVPEPTALAVNRKLLHPDTRLLETVAALRAAEPWTSLPLIEAARLPLEKLEPLTRELMEDIRLVLNRGDGSPLSLPASPPPTALHVIIRVELEHRKDALIRFYESRASFHLKPGEDGLTRFRRDFSCIKVKQPCATCGGRDAESRCSRCKQVYYCNRDCQSQHWPTHKTECKKPGAGAAAVNS